MANRHGIIWTIIIYDACPDGIRPSVAYRTLANTASLIVKDTTHALRLRLSVRSPVEVPLPVHAQLVE